MSEEVLLTEPTIGTSEGEATTPADIFGYQPNPIGDFFTNINSYFSNLFGATPKVTTDNVNLSSGFPIKTVAVAGATTAGAISSAIILTNPGFQSTTQQVSKNLSVPLTNITDALKSAGQATSSILSSQYGPFLVGGLIILGFVLVVKK